MRNTNGPNKGRNIKPDQATYNIEPAIEQLCRDLDAVFDLQKKSIEYIKRIEYNGEKLFSPEVFPKAKKISTIGDSFVANCMDILSCSQYLRNRVFLYRVELRNLVELTENRTSDARGNLLFNN